MRSGNEKRENLFMAGSEDDKSEPELMTLELSEGVTLTRDNSAAIAVDGFKDGARFKGFRRRR